MAASGAASGLITILFTDLVGSTALGQQLGDRGADEIRRDHFAQLRTVVHVTGGTEVKTIGDALMVSYNSASDAIDGAVAMQQQVHAHRQRTTLPIEMRVGISAGDATFESGDWFGTPVVEASRLCSAAGSGQILVTEVVQVLAGSRCRHELAPIGEIDGKGLAAPMRASEVRWEPEADHRGGRLTVPLPPQVQQGDTFGFVGRDEHQQALLGAWKTATVSGRLAVFVGGEPGIGKTRLVKELCRAAHDQGGVVLWGACDEEISLPYQPFVEGLRWLTEVTPPDTLADLIGDTGGELATLVPDLGQRVAGLRPRLNDDPESERYRLFEAVTDLLRNLSAREPVVLVLDDLHWAGRPTLLLLRHLLKTTKPMQLLVVATYRDTDLDRTHPLAEMLADLRRQGGVERLTLRGLDEAGVASFLAHTAGHELDERGLAFAAAIAAETEGNPFFIGEVLRHLSESGALVYRNGRWESDHELGEVGIPEGVREVIGRRLSHLDAETNDVLAAAAVIGREFALRILSAVAGGDDRVLDAVGGAETAGLVEAVNGRPGTYRFAHALVRSALYDELPTSRRLRLHRDVARTFEALGDPGLHLNELARHFTEAAALGEVDQAIRYCRLAGDAAIAELAFEEAAAHFERALEALELREPVDDVVRAELLLSAGNALFRIDDPRGRELLLAADALTSGYDDPTMTAKVFIALSSNVFGRPDGRDDDQVARAERVLERADLLDPAVHAEVMACLSDELFWDGELARRRQLCDRALEIARGIGDPVLVARALESRVVAGDMTDPSELDDSLAITAEIIEVAAGIDDSLVGTALEGQVTVRACRGDVAGAEQALAQAESLAERLRLPFRIARARTLRTSLTLLSGNLDATDVLLADLESFAARNGLVAITTAAGSIRYRLQYERGDLGELEPFLVAVIEAQPHLPVWRMALCGVYLQTGRPELARPHVEKIGADDFAIVARNQVFLLTCSSTARVAAAVGALDVAEAAYHYAAPFDGQLPFSGAVWEYPVGVGVGAAATALGWYDRAERHFARALDLCERAGAVTYAAATQVHWAEMLAQRGSAGDGDHARRKATEALEVADRIGLTYIATRARQVLATG